MKSRIFARMSKLPKFFHVKIVNSGLKVPDDTDLPTWSVPTKIKTKLPRSRAMVPQVADLLFDMSHP
jgi:hypothetical protein